jgi:amidase
MTAGQLSSVELVNYYLTRIRVLDKRVNSILELNPDAHAIARRLDNERRANGPRGPLHGIPILLKDNIDTHDRMQTTAGSFALAGQPAVHDSTVAGLLRAAGAVLLGKANLSEWANFRSFFPSSGWSGRGGQTHNPYALDRNPSGSSSGSAAAVAANFAAAALGSETDGSVISPSSNCGVVGIKPTVGLTSRAGVVPISHTQDTVGVHGRRVADAAVVLSIIASAGFDGRDPATGGVPLGKRGSTRPVIDTHYTNFLDPDGLKGANIGVTRQGFGAAGATTIDGASPKAAAVFEDALAAMTDAGATLVDLDDAGFTFPSGDGEFLVLLFDFVFDLKAYFATRVGVPMAGKALEDAIAFNIAHADVEMPFFAQELFELAAAIDVSSPDAPQPIFGGLTYNQALQIDQDATVNGIDKALHDFNVQAITVPTSGPAWPIDLIDADHFIFESSPFAAIGGYPVVQVPSGNTFGLPLGISFVGTAFSEPTLIKLASGFEHVTHARIVPKFFPTLPLEHVSGIPLAKAQAATARAQSKPELKAPAFRPRSL